MVKKYWYLIVLLVITLGLGVMVFITTGQLSSKKPVTDGPPKAAVPACTLTFSIAVTPTPTQPVACNYPCTTDSNCANGNICSNGFCRNPACVSESDCLCAGQTPTPTFTPTKTPTPTATPSVTSTPTPTQPVACNYACTVNDDCMGDNVCANGYCRNPLCTEETDCLCAGQTPTPTNTPTPTTMVTATPTPTTPPVATCNETCSVNTDCGMGLVCLDNVCRNPSCSEATNCVCQNIAVQPTPKIPVSGGPSIMGVTSILGGALLLLLGFLL